MGHLEDLVPPVELCEQLPPGAFSDSALVHVEVFALDGVATYKDIIPRACLETCYADLIGTIRAPAPTAQEIMDALYMEAEDTCKCPCDFIACERGTSGWEAYSSYVCSANCADCDECKDTQIFDTHNPAVALLKVYLKTKGVKYE